MGMNVQEAKRELANSLQNVLEITDWPETGDGFADALESEPLICESFEHTFAAYLLWKECRKHPA